MVEQGTNKNIVSKEIELSKPNYRDIVKGPETDKMDKAQAAKQWA